jgi:hypothetical protein
MKDPAFVLGHETDAGACLVGDGEQHHCRVHQTVFGSGGRSQANVPEGERPTVLHVGRDRSDRKVRGEFGDAPPVSFAVRTIIEPAQVARIR